MSNELQNAELDSHAAQIEKSLIDAAQSFLKIGEALVAAKLILKNDVDFKEWRETRTSVKSQRTALAYMQVYKRFAQTKLSGQIGYSVLHELVSAPSEVVEQVEQMVEEGESPTVKETRELVKDAKAEGNIKETNSKEEEGNPARNIRTMSDIIAEGEGEGERDPKPRTPSWLVDERVALALPETTRVLEASDPWHVFGLSAFFETMPSIDTIHRLNISLGGTYSENKEASKAIKKAYGEILEEISNVNGE